jgi:P-type Ca2+ transporter type 2C
MTVVEAYFGGTKLDPCYDTSQMSVNVASLIIEGIAQNTTGTVFLSEVQKSKPPPPIIS